MKHIALLLTSLLFAATLYAQTPHPLGLKFTKHGVHRPDVSILFKVAPLPQSDYSLEQYFYPTNQQTLGSCGAFSGFESFDAISQQIGAGKCRLSAMDIYQRTTDWPNDAGVSNAQLIKTMEAGAVLESTFPYNVGGFGKLLPVTDAVKAERAAHVTLNGYSLSPNDLKNSIKRCITQLHIAPIVGTYWYRNQFDARRVNVKTKVGGKSATVARFIIDNPRGIPQGGHDIPAVAYDDNMVFPNGDVGGVEFHNHWSGPAWGDDRGCAWSSYKFLCNPRYADDVIAFDKIKH